MQNLKRYILIGSFLLLTFAWGGGFIATLPEAGTTLDAQGNLGQTARNLFFHVPMWLAMYFAMFTSLYWSLKFLLLKEGDPRLLEYDIKAREAAKVGVFWGILGLLTGIVWSRVTWGRLLPDSDPYAWWMWDPKQTLALIAILLYVSYFILRQQLQRPLLRARIAAIYNLFAGFALLPLTLIIPRMTESLHPGGKEGSPLFQSQDISNEYRLYFYPAILGVIGLAWWFWQIRVSIFRFKENSNAR